MQQVLGGPRAALVDTLGEEAATELVLDTLALTYGTKVRHGVDVLNTAGTQVDAALDIDLSAGNEVRWAYRPPDRLDGKLNEVAEVRSTATLTVGPTALAVESFRYRIWTELQAADGTWVRFNKFYGVSTNPPVDDDGLFVSRTLRLAEKTYRYKQRELVDPIVHAAAVNPITALKASLTAVFGETAFSIPDSDVTLDEEKAFPAGMSYLAYYNALLEAAAYDQLTIDVDNGRPQSVALADLAGRGAEWGYGPGAGKIKVASQVSPLLETLPNQVIFVARQGPSLAEEGNGQTTITNQSTGPASVDQRGETISIRVLVDAEDQAELDAIAAAEAQRYFAGGGLRFTGRVGLNPLHGDRDVIELDKPRFAQAGVAVAGTWLVTEWTYPIRKIEAGSEDTVLGGLVAEKRVVI